MKRSLILLVLTLAPRFASACTVCFGDPNSASAQAIGLSIFFLLGTLGTVFLGAGAFVFTLARRAKSPLADPRDFLTDDTD